MDAQLRFQIDWSLWLQWIVATAAGLLIGVTAGLAINSVAIGVAGEEVGLIVYWVALGVVVGATIGTLQWLVLRRRFTHTGQWVLVSTAAWVAGWIPTASVVGLVVGIVAGLLQWVILRRWVARASVWVVASAVGWTASEAVLRSVGRAGISALTFGIAGAAAGAITGGALVWLSQWPVREDEPIETAETDPRRR